MSDPDKASETKMAKRLSGKARFKGYGPKRSDAAAWAAEWGSIPASSPSSPEQAERWALKAAAHGDLLHPDTWESWALARQESFERALKAITPAELKKLEVAVNESGQSWAVAFSGSSKKLRALAGLGLDYGLKICGRECEGAPWRRVDAATLCCLYGWSDSLMAMREAGFNPPGRLDARAQIAWGPEGDEITPLQALASVSLDRPPRLREAMEWLCSDGIGVSETDGEGEDALKFALRASNAQGAIALLDLGARVEDKNAKGQDAFDVLKQEIARLESVGWGAGDLGALAPRMAQERARAEARAIEAAAGLASARAPSMRM